MSSPTPCDCVFLDDDQSCYDCFVRVWDFYVTSCGRKAQEEYELLHPRASLEYMDALREEIKTAAFAAAWKNHRDRLSSKTDTFVVKKAVAEAKEKFMFNRCLMLTHHILPTMEAEFSRHCLVSDCTEEGVHYSGLQVCRECANVKRGKLTSPPHLLREWLQEILLGSTVIVKSRSYLAKADACFEYCRRLLHQYMDAGPMARLRLLAFS